MEETTSSFSFSDFPEDVQLCILSFLEPSHLSSFACTSRRNVSICRDDPRLWFAMCDRRWGSHTCITKWGRNAPNISYKRLYKTLREYETLIGFWRLCSSASTPQPPPAGQTAAPNLVLFEWGPFYVTGSRVLPLKKATYKVQKVPFLLICVNSKGEAVNFLDPEGSIELSGDLEDLRVSESGLIPVNVSFIGQSHIVVEETEGMAKSLSFSPESEGKRVMARVLSSNDVKEEDGDGVYGSPGTNWTMLEIYQHLANPTRSPGGNGPSRRQRRREKEKLGRRKWESQHFVKIVNCSPTPARPLQGLWKGICEDMSLEFYLVAYDDIGGIACRRIWDSSSASSNPVFWTSDATFTDSPFSAEEEHTYDARVHLHPLPLVEDDDRGENLLPSEIGTVSRMLYITSSYDWVIPGLAGTNLNPRQVEGRIWQYENGTFGFGFLGNDYIIDLKHIVRGGHLLDTVELRDDS